jgi:TP901-1 family phage major tail protein
MPEFQLGMNAKAYFGLTPVAAATEAAITGATLVELTNIKDLTINLETGEADVTTRANAGWRTTAATLREMTIEFEMQWKTGDAGFEAIKDAWLAADEIVLAALDQEKTVTGAQGPAGNFVITNFSRSEPLEEAMTVSVTAKASSFPQWFEKSA